MSAVTDTRRSAGYGMAWYHWLILLLCGSMLVGNARALHEAWSSADWPVVDATVVANGSVGNPSRPADRRGSVTLRYRIDGREYEHTEWNSTLRGENGARLAAGAPATVRVEPGHPEHAVAVSGLQRIGRGWWWSGLFALGVPLLLVWNAWYRPRTP